MLSNDKFFRDRLAEMARRENTLRQEQWKLQQREEGHSRCLGNPRTCGSGIWKAGLRMSAWEQINAGRATGGGFSGHDPNADANKYKTRQEMQRAVFGQEYVDRQQRASAIGVELDTIKTQREGEIAQHNAEQMALIDKEFKRVEKEDVARGKIHARKMQAKGDHPEYSTTRPPPKRHKSGARAKFVPRRATRR